MVLTGPSGRSVFTLSSYALKASIVTSLIDDGGVISGDRDMVFG